MGRCYLLELEPELRNEIYSLVFAINPDLTGVTESSEAPSEVLSSNSSYASSSEYSLTPDMTGFTELSKASPPSISLLKTCKQVYNEAKGIYAHACRQYWRETRFKILSYHEDEEWWRSHHTEHLQDQEIEILRHLEVHNVEDDYVDVLLDVRGGWLASEGRSELSIIGNTPYIRIRPWLPAEGPRALQWQECPSYEAFATKEELMQALATHGQEVSFIDQIRLMVEHYFCRCA